MSRVISVDGTGTERNRLSKSIVLSLRELMKQNKPDAHSYDLAAYIVLALEQIDANIDKTVGAWEKRDYWVKADRFRMQWGWVRGVSTHIKSALIEGDWAGIAQQAVIIGQKLSAIEVSDKHRLGTPWVGAWNKLRKEIQQSSD